jgi:hypothetical protein
LGPNESERSEDTKTEAIVTTNDKTWESLVAGYLRQVENSLADVGHPSCKAIVDEVRAHLEQRYADLPAEKRNWDGYQETITEMGPPSDYAELLSTEKVRRRIVTWPRIAIAVLLLLSLLFWGGYVGMITSGFNLGPTVYSIPDSSSPVAVPHTGFETDPRLVGEWTSVGFVSSPADFSPHRDQPSDLWMTGLEFRQDGAVLRATKDSETMEQGRLTWTKDWILSREHSIQAQYEIKQIEGETILFFPWLSGDVTVHNEAPSYYVMKKLKSNNP